MVNTGKCEEPQTHEIQMTNPRTKDHRARSDRLSAIPVKDILKMRMDDLEMTNLALQKALGYSNPNVIAMMKNGSMRVPEEKAFEVARILEVEPILFLRMVIEENKPTLWDAIMAVMSHQRSQQMSQRSFLHCV